MRETQKSLAVVAAFVVIVAGVEVALQGHDRDEPLVISLVVLEESHDVDRNLVDEIYRARLTHTGRTGGVDFARVTAKIVAPFGWAMPGLTLVIDGDLAFGAVRAGDTVESVDTVTIRRLRHQPLKPGQLRWDIDARPDLVPSDAWAGRWRFTLTYKDASNEITRISDVSSTIGTGAPLGLSLLSEAARCGWGRSDTLLQVSCNARVRTTSCLADATSRFELTRDGAAAAGRGDWRIDYIGDCGDVFSGTGAVEIVGTRLGDDVEPEPFALGLLTSFVTVPGFSSLVADGIREGTLDRPKSERDCTRGGWHRFISPMFRNEHACRDLFGPHDGRHVDWRQ